MISNKNFSLPFISTCLYVVTKDLQWHAAMTDEFDALLSNQT